MRKFKNLRSIQEADAADYVKKPDDDEEATDYKPRSDGEAEFAAKHKGTTDKHPHADDNQFKAVDVDHVDHKDAESDNVDGEKQPVKSGTKTFSNFRQTTQTPLRRGDKRQGDFKAGSVKEEVELDEGRLPKYGSSVKFSTVMKKIKDGTWVTPSSGLVKPKSSLEIRDTESNKKTMIWVEEVELDEAKKVTKKQLRDLEDRNEHGLVALKLAQSFGTPAEVKKIQDINKRHNMKGHIEYKDQKERDAIASKYWKMAEEVDLDEGTSRALKQLDDPENDKAFPGAKKMFKRKYRADKSKEAKIRTRRKFGKDDGDTAMGAAMKKAMRKEEVELDEAVKAGTIKLENGKSIKVTKEDAAAFNAVLKELNPDNRKRMESEMMKDEKSYKNMLTFAKRTS